MKPSLSGFTIIRNAERYDYPIVESIRSILRICDEFVVNVGVSDDSTLEIVQSINSPKMKIFMSSWDLSLNNEREVLSIETNKAIERCSSDWCFYLHADELVHDKYLPVIEDAIHRNHHKKNIEGFVFGFNHFYGSYDYIQDNYRQWYPREIRIIHRHSNITSWNNATSFRHADGSRLRTVRIPAKIYHYGYVYPPQEIQNKRNDFQKYVHGKNMLAKKKYWKMYPELGHLERFTGSHPTVMTNRIVNSHWEFDAKLDEQPPKWIRHLKLFFS